MSKQLILFMLFMFISFNFSSPRISQEPAEATRSLKTPDKGPVLHPLRQKPYQKRLISKA